MTGPTFIIGSIVCGVIFWRLVVWMSGLDRQVPRDIDWDAEWDAIVEELRK